MAMYSVFCKSAVNERLHPTHLLYVITLQQSHSAPISYQLSRKSHGTMQLRSGNFTISNIPILKFPVSGLLGSLKCSHKALQAGHMHVLCVLT